jgi:hypothetical protein
MSIILHLEIRYVLFNGCRWRKADIGIVRVKAMGVRHRIEQRALVELLPDWSGDTFPLYALYPSRHLPAKVRAFTDFVQSRMLQAERRVDHSPAGKKAGEWQDASAAAPACFGLSRKMSPGGACDPARPLFKGPFCERIAASDGSF